MVVSSKVSALLALQTLSPRCLGTVLDLDLLDVVDLPMIMNVVDLHVAATVLVVIATVRDLLVGITMTIAEAVVDTDLPLVLVDHLKTTHLPAVVVAVATRNLTVETTLQLTPMSMVLLDRMSVVLHVITLQEMLVTPETTNVATNFSV